MSDTDTTAAPEVQYATVEELLAEVHDPPKPLQEDYTGIKGKTFRIEGATRYIDREAIKTTINALLETAKAGQYTVTVGADTFTPSESDIADAVWCNACVKKPYLLIMQWLQYGSINPGDLRRLSARALVCSRLIPDVDAATEEVKTPDGITEAKEVLSRDPLEPPGDDTVSAS